jgi:hypothetical protein
MHMVTLLIGFYQYTSKQLDIKLEKQQEQLPLSHFSDIYFFDKRDNFNLMYRLFYINPC